MSPQQALMWGHLGRAPRGALWYGIPTAFAFHSLISGVPYFLDWKSISSSLFHLQLLAGSVLGFWAGICLSEDKHQWMIKTALETKEKVGMESWLKKCSSYQAFGGSAERNLSVSISQGPPCPQGAINPPCLIPGVKYLWGLGRG